MKKDFIIMKKWGKKLSEEAKYQKRNQIMPKKEDLKKKIKLIPNIPEYANMKST
jgi:hypothetical protein